MIKTLVSLLKGTRIILVSRDVKFLYKVSKILKENKINYAEFMPPSGLGPRSVVITTHKECENIEAPLKICLEEADELRLLVSLAECALSSEGLNVEYVVGIDPGKNYGLALIASGILVKGFTVRGLKEALDLLTSLSRVLGVANYRLKVGGQISPHELSLLLSSISPRSRIELVNEALSSAKKRLFKELRREVKDEDILSACAIALCRGKEIKPPQIEKNDSFSDLSE